MKTLLKTLTLVLFGIILFTSCKSTETEEIPWSERPPKEVKLVPKYVGYHNGHRYYEFTGFYGLVHDPDCPLCNEE